MPKVESSNEVLDALLNDFLGELSDSNEVYDAILNDFLGELSE